MPTQKESAVWGPRNAEHTDVLVYCIKRVHPRIVVVMTGHPVKQVELTLALNQDGYKHMIKLSSNPELQSMYPLVFAVDPKGYVLGWITQRKMEEEPDTNETLKPEKTE
jgi:hypothetical protein